MNTGIRTISPAAVVLTVLFLLAPIALAESEERDGTFRAERTLSGAIERPGGAVSAGGAFVLRVDAVDRARGGEFTLTREGGARDVDGSGCLCGGPIFADGFESGDTGDWGGLTTRERAAAPRTSEEIRTTRSP